MTSSSSRVLKRSLGLAASIAVIFAVQAAQTEANATRERLAPLEVADDSGGYVGEYAVRVEKLRAEGRPVAIEGRCVSACTLYLTLPSNQTCITEAANFGFHAPSGQSAEINRKVQEWMMSRYPSWVRSWIASQTGQLTAQLITMDSNYARRHLRTCGHLSASR
jgi:hypothetical protein